MDGYGDGRWGMHSGGLGWLMLLLMVVLVVAVVVAAVALLRGTVPTAAPHAVATRPATDARSILQDRFARGDIDESDYRARMRALDETGASPG